MLRCATFSLALAAVLPLVVADRADACGHTNTLVADDAKYDVEEAEESLEAGHFAEAAESARRALENDAIRPRDQWRANAVLASATIMSQGALGQNVDGDYVIYTAPKESWRTARLKSAKATLDRISTHDSFKNNVAIIAAKHSASTQLQAIADAKKATKPTTTLAAR